MEKNSKLDQEMDELVDIIREYNIENAELQDLFDSCCNELQDEIKALERRNQNHSSRSMQKTETSSSNETENSHEDERIYSILKKEIQELREEMILKNRKIRALELEISSCSVLYHKCKERLQHLSMAYNNKTIEMKAEIEQLKIATLRTRAKECEDEVTDKIAQGELNHQKYIKKEIEEIRNMLMLSLNS